MLKNSNKSIYLKMAGRSHIFVGLHFEVIIYSRISIGLSRSPSEKSLIVKYLSHKSLMIKQFSTGMNICTSKGIKFLGKHFFSLRHLHLFLKTHFSEIVVRCFLIEVKFIYRGSVSLQRNWILFFLNWVMTLTLFVSNWDNTEWMEKDGEEGVWQFKNK